MKKNIIKYSTIALLVAVMSGCLKLDQAPTNSFTDDVFWTSAERAQSVMNMAYNQMYRHGWIWDDECLSDNMVATTSTDGVNLIRKGGATSAASHFQGQWKAIFEGIKTTNVFMDKVDLVPNMDPDLKARMKAEIRFIRASLYFRAVNFWGDCPFFLRDITVVEAKNMTRMSKNKILSELHRELDEIMYALPLRQDLPKAENGRITRGAAMMLKIRLYLMEPNLAGMPQVESLCRRFIDGEFGSYSLFTDSDANFSAYERLFHSVNEYNREVILDYSAMPIVKEWNTVGMTPQTIPGRVLTSRTPTQSLADSYITLDGLPVKGGVTHPEPYASDPNYNEGNPYTNRDPRMDATITRHLSVWKDKNSSGNIIQATIYIKPGTAGNRQGIEGAASNDEYQSTSGTKTGYYIRKYYDPDHRDNQQMHNNIIMMRYADVLLMYAEACLVNGNFSENVWNETIKLLRQRAGFTNSPALNMPTGLDDTDLRDIIHRERRCELALEGLRYFDIIRWGEGTTYLNGRVYGAMFLAGNTQYIPVDSWKFNPERDGLWSIPFYEMDKAPSLRPNNPNY